MKRIVVLLLVIMLAAGLASGIFGLRTVYAAEDEYSYDTRFAGYLGRGLIHDEKMAGREKHYGIDVSAHQKEIDWKAVADSGAEFVFIRVGYRGYGTGVLVEDEYLEKNLKGALENGLMVGVYLFSQAITVEEGIEEADFTMQLLEKYGLGPANILLPVVYDVEFPYSDGKPVGRLYEAQLDSRTRTDIALAFLERIKAGGYTPCFYGSRSALSSNSKANMAEINGKYKVWLAAYTANRKSGYDGPYEFWQYSSSGKVPGIDGVVDLDVWYLDAKAQTGWVPLKTDPAGSGESGRGKAVGFMDPLTGKFLTGWQTIAGRTYLFDGSGAMLTGWQNVQMAGNGSGSPQEVRCYFGRSGVLRTGWEDVDGSRYLFDDSGAMLTGWQDADGSRYYFGPDGVMRTGPVFIEGKLYLLGLDGKMQTGWQVLADEFYYFTIDGAALTGRQSIGRWQYSFSDEGKLEWGLVPVYTDADGLQERQKAAVVVLPWTKICITK